ncbi:unnamed protein product [Prunus armeniaca]
MASSIEARGVWTNVKDILSCACWVKVGHCPITGIEMKSSHMWRKTHGEFCERSGSTHTEMALTSRWKILNKELGKWRDVLAKPMDNIRSGQNLADEIIQAQMWFGAIGQGKKSCINHQCCDVVKNCSRFKIISTGPTIVLNETLLHESQATDSPLDSPMDQESPIQRELRPIGRKAAKAKRGSTSNTKCAKFEEQIAKNERDLKREEADKARYDAYAIERQQAQEQDMKDREIKIMAMVTSHMSPKTKSYWKLK